MKENERKWKKIWEKIWKKMKENERTWKMKENELKMLGI